MVPTSVACRWRVSGASTTCIGARCVLPSSAPQSGAELGSTHRAPIQVVDAPLTRHLHATLVGTITGCQTEAAYFPARLTQLCGLPVGHPLFTEAPELRTCT